MPPYPPPTDLLGPLLYNPATSALVESGVQAGWELWAILLLAVTGVVLSLLEWWAASAHETE